MIDQENLNNIINTVIIPIIQIGFPISLILAITEKVINMILSFIRGDKTIKL